MTSRDGTATDREDECSHEWERASPLYVNGLPLYRCTLCDARGVPEDEEPSFKALITLKPREEA